MMNLQLKRFTNCYSLQLVKFVLVMVMNTHQSNFSFKLNTTPMIVIKLSSKISVNGTKLSLVKKQSGLMNANKVAMSIISISLIGKSNQVQKLFHYLEECYKTVKVAGSLLTGHTGLLMLLNTQVNLSQVK
jgi:hypothetical protein